MHKKRVWAKIYKNNKLSTTAPFLWDNKYVTNNSTKFVASNTLTAEAWVYIRHDCVKTQQPLMSVWHLTDSWLQNWLVLLELVNSIDNEYRIVFHGGGGSPAYTGSFIKKAQWHHIAVTFQTGVGVKFYVNGAQTQTIVNRTNPLTPNITTFDIGRINGANSVYAELCVIQEVRVWSSVRTKQEIQENMYNYLSGSEPGLLGYYKLNEGSGILAVDSASFSPQNGLISSSTVWQNEYFCPLKSSVYAGTFIDFEYSNFTSSIYSGLGDLTLVIPRNFDNYNNDDAISNGNTIKVYVNVNQGTPNTNIYTGIIEEFTTVSGSDENVQIYCTGTVRALSNVYPSTEDILQYGMFNGIQASAAVLKVVDFFNINNSHFRIKADSSTVPTTTQIVLVIPVSNTYRELLDEITTQAGENFFWYLDGNDTLYFKQFSSTPNHVFVFKKHISEITFSKTIKHLVNSVFFWNGFKSSDPSFMARNYISHKSQTRYGVRSIREKDARITSSYTSGKRYHGIFNLKDKELNVFEFEVNDQYPIETIKPGDTCRIVNINSEIGIPSVMVILGVEYNINSVKLTIQDVKYYTSRRLDQMQRDKARTDFSENVKYNPQVLC